MKEADRTNNEALIRDLAKVIVQQLHDGLSKALQPITQKSGWASWVAPEEEEGPLSASDR